MKWECTDAAYCGRVTMRDVTHAGRRGKTCAEVIISGAPKAVGEWLENEPTWRDEADKLDGIRAAMARGLRVKSQDVKAISVPMVNMTIEAREFTAHVHGADVTWYETDYPEYLYRPDPYRYEETCRRICRWVAKVGAENIERMTFEQFNAAMSEVAGRTPVSVRQYVATTHEFDDDSWLDQLDGLEPVPF